MIGQQLRFGVLSDLHLAEPGTRPYQWINPQPLGSSSDLFVEATARLEEHSPDAILLLGDLTDRGTATQFDLLQRLLEPVATPVWAIPGNHDLYGGLRDPLGTAAIQTPSVDHTLAGRHGRLVLGAGMLTGDPEEDVYRETRAPAPDAWTTDAPMVWLSHYPVLDVRPVLDAAGLPHPGDLVNRGDVHQALRARTGPTLVLAGHVHVHAVAVDSGVLQLNHAPLIEQPHAFTVLDLSIRDDEFEVTWHAHTLEPRHSAPVDPFLCSRRERWLWAGRWTSHQA